MEGRSVSEKIKHFNDLKNRKYKNDKQGLKDNKNVKRQVDYFNELAKRRAKQNARKSAHKLRSKRKSPDNQAEVEKRHKRNRKRRSKRKRKSKKSAPEGRLVPYNPRRSVKKKRSPLLLKDRNGKPCSSKHKNANKPGYICNPLSGRWKKKPKTPKPRKAKARVAKRSKKKNNLQMIPFIPPQPNDPNMRLDAIPFTMWPDDIQQGKEGINKYIVKEFKRYNLFSDMQIKCSKTLSPMAYQYFVYQLVKPHSIIQRMLCVHRTGAGKTLTMIMCLNNFYHDSRDKVLIFPTQSVAQNFYGEIMKFPNRYRDYVLKTLGNDILDKLYSDSKKSASTARKKVADVLALKNVLRRAGKPGYPGGALRTYRYSQNPSVVDPLFKKNLQAHKNPYNDKIIIMDEVHNLVVPAPEMVRYTSKLIYKADKFKSCTDSVIVGFTATPFLNRPEEGTVLLDIIKGGATDSNEGYISYFNSLPKSIYPVLKPNNKIGNIVKVKLEGTNLEYYEKMKKKLLHSEDNMYSRLSEKEIMKLMNAANMSTYYAQTWRQKFQNMLASNPNSEATKLHKLVTDVMKKQRKSLIIIHRAHGFKALKLMFEIVAKELHLEHGCKNKCLATLYDKDADGAALVQQFNKPSNIEGDEIMTMVIDAQNYSEGVSFFGVRDCYLMNPPRTLGSYEQRIGRILRACSYEALPANQRNTTVHIYIAEDTVDEYLLDKLTSERDIYDANMKLYFEDPAMDKGFYK